jgi:HEAT repeat protein
VLPKLEACALKGDPMDKSAHARKGCYIALSRLGDEKTLARWNAWQAAEPAASSKACMKEMYFDDAKGKEAAQAHCDALAASVVKILEENKPRLLAHDACKADRECWVGKLGAEDPLVRERAAIELGHLDDAASVPALMKALEDTNLEARFAAIMATDWLASSSKEGLTLAKQGLDKLETQIESEKDKVHYAKINEDLKRLSVKIRRLDRSGI